MKKTLLLLTGLCLSGMLLAQPLDLPFSEDFEGSLLIPPTFTLVNGDNGTPADAPASLKDSAFIVRYSDLFFSNVAYTTSWYNEADLDCDDWLILPQLSLTGNAVLTWKAMSLTSSGNYPDDYEVLISTTDADPASFTVLQTINDESWRVSAGGNGISERTIRLGDAGYANQDVYLAFHVITPYDNGDRIAFDDIKVQEELFEGFEGTFPGDWAVINGGDNPGTWFQDDYDPYAGDYAATVQTWDNATNTVDDWLISPQITVFDGYVLSFFAMSSSSNYPDALQVLVSKTGTATGDFTVTVANITAVPAGGYTKYSYVLSENVDISPGDQIYIAFYTNVIGDYLSVDNVRYGEFVPPQMSRAAAVSETAVDVWFDSDLDRVYSPGEFTLTGSESVTFTDAQVDGTDPRLLHLTGGSPAMTGDVTLDKLTYLTMNNEFEFYAGIMPLEFTSLTNPGGTMDFDGHFATFRGVVTAYNNDDRVWITDGAAPHHGVNTYDMYLESGVNVGDEILLYGKLSPYKNQTEIYPANYLATVSTGNTVTPLVIDGLNIATNVALDSDPGEKYEGLLVTIEAAKVTNWDGAYFTCTDDNGTTSFYVADLFDLFSGTFDNTTLVTDHYYDLTGVVTNYDAGDDYYKLILRGPSDISDVTAVEDPGAAALKVYPNPFTSVLSLDNLRGIKTVSLTNMLGQQLLSRDVDQDLHMDFDTDMLPKGIYFLRLTTDSGGLVVKKVTKK